MDDKVLKVVRAYEDFTKKLEYEEKVRRQHGKYSGVLSDTAFQNHLLGRTLARAESEKMVKAEISTKGLVRWQGEGGLKIDSIRILNKEGFVSRKIEVGQPAKIEFTVRADYPGTYPTILVIVIYSIEDKLVTRHISDKSVLKFNAGQTVVFTIMFDEILFGPGHYYFSSAIYRHLDMTKQNEAAYYDLLNRAIEFEVIAGDSTYVDLVKQPGSWDLRR